MSSHPLRRCAALAFLAVLGAANAANAVDKIAIRVVVRANGALVRNAYVGWLARDRPSSQPAMEMIAADGTASARLDPGPYTLVTGADGHQPSSTQVEVDASQKNVVTTALLPEQFISGTVSDADGNPISDARVAHVRDALSPLALRTFGRRWSTKSDDTGRWTISVPSEFGVNLAIEADGFAPAWLYWKPGAHAPFDVTLRRGAALRMRLDRVDEQIAITLLRPAEIAGDSIPRTWQAQLWERVVNRDRLEWRSLPPGQYRVLFRSLDPVRFLDVEDAGIVTLAEGENPELHVALPRATSQTKTPITMLIDRIPPSFLEELRAWEPGPDGRPMPVRHNLVRVSGGTVAYLATTADASDLHFVTGTNLFVPRTSLGAEASKTTPLRTTQFDRGTTSLRVIPAQKNVPLPVSGVAHFHDCAGGWRVKVPFAIERNGAVKFPHPSSCRTLLLSLDPLEPKILSLSIRRGETRDLGSLMFSAAANVTVRVLAGEPAATVAGIMVRAYLASAAGARATPVADARTGDDGIAVLERLPTSELLIVEAEMTGSKSTASESLVLKPGERAILDPLVIQRPASLLVEARLAASFRERHPEALIKEIQVIPIATDVRRTPLVVIPDERGSATFTAIRPGNWQASAIVDVDKESQMIEIGDVELRAGKTSALRKEIEPLIYRGLVTAAGRGVEVQLQIWGDGGGHPARSTSDGTFEIILPARGSYRVSAVPLPDMDNWIEAGSFDFGDPAVRVEIALPEGGINVSVRDGERPAVGALVNIDKPSGGRSRIAMESVVTRKSDGDGHVSFDSLLEGTWIVRARREEGGRAAEKSVVITARESTPVDLQLAQSTEFDGEVRGAIGPAPSATIDCLYSGIDGFPRFVTAKTDARGHFAIELPPATSSVLRCGITTLERTIGTFVGTASRETALAVGQTPSGSLTINDWGRKRRGDSVWLVAADGRLFNLAWAGARRGSDWPSLTLNGIPAGLWRLMAADSLAEWAALARGATTSLKTIAELRIEANRTYEMTIDSMVQSPP